jgi:hypothetical protein
VYAKIESDFIAAPIRTLANGEDPVAYVQSLLDDE